MLHLDSHYQASNNISAERRLRVMMRCWMFGDGDEERWRERWMERTRKWREVGIAASATRIRVY
jgi:hypothetical protein